ncbi:hypothetical protein N2603_34020 [Bradyrhizobium huanghuaihaiense]|uniref:hypothetical protein n=1 Tax=Bradyrhizobium huanghuaihaiense TaxID=990078 RepID=UPI0021AA4AA4|nr:hypothetical protein [Bradyrhizobium sp. CB3035]UWU75031.1 hypothetical protein N2603_34020 [Bradyrhizobium sp. CB3035]
MVEPHPTVLDGKLTYVSSKPSSGAAIGGIVIALGLMLVFAKGATGTVVTPAGAAGLLIALVVLAISLLLTVMRRWTVEFDLTGQKLTISQSLLGRPNTIVFDCPLDECIRVGTMEYRNEGGASYGAYVELKQGGKYSIPLPNGTLRDVSLAVSHLVRATGIPRFDTVA